MFSTNEEDEPKKTRLLANIIKDLGPDETTGHLNEEVAQISTTTRETRSRGRKFKSRVDESCKHVEKVVQNISTATKKIRSRGRKSKSCVDESCKHVEKVVPKVKEDPKANVASIKKANTVGGIVICEPNQSEAKGMKNFLINNNDEESNIDHKGKGNLIQTNELDSSSSSEEEDLAFASHSKLFPYDTLRFGEGASKFFQDGTDFRRQLNIGEGIKENALEDIQIPQNHVQENIAMPEVTDVLKDKLPNVGNANGLIGHSILFKATRGIGEEEVKFEKRISRKSKPQKKRDPKKRK
ncbi:hypothetical protein MtrunA17_Chr1g0146111 [Medicago truncatula]|uniref:Uncharacterized protein n=1 Tax=Medicago truncatula TaxID=3880 RepID=A0A396JH70_MEDTR|nr:hypothetical protein MtrunA17_Chr1g0146111 [Medicago truncatula]